VSFKSFFLTAFRQFLRQSHFRLILGATDPSWLVCWICADRCWPSPTCHGFIQTRTMAMALASSSCRRCFPQPNEATSLKFPS